MRYPITAHDVDQALHRMEIEELKRDLLAERERQAYEKSTRMWRAITLMLLGILTLVAVVAVLVHYL